MFKYGIPHDENWTYLCPCGGMAIGRFVIPSNRGKFAVIGTCQECADRGDDKTTTMLIASTPKDGFGYLLTHSTILFNEKEG